MVAVQIAACAVAFVVACAWVHRRVLHTDAVTTRTATYTDATGCRRSVTYKAIGGDWGTAMVAREIFQDDVYTRHGVHVPLVGSPLVVDIGANIGLFSAFVMATNAQAVVVAAEPIPRLCALAVDNTASFRERVWVEKVGVAATAQSGVEFLVDPRVTAGASMYEADITRPWKATALCTQLAVVGRDNVTSGNLPAQPTLWLCGLLETPYVRWAATLALMPALVLLIVFLLTSPSQRRRVRCECVVFAELLQRAASHVRSSSLRHSILHDPIALVKIDVEGAEWDVVQGITAADWQRIQQIVVEVHDVEGRVQCVVRLLRSQGFDEVHVEQEAWASHEVLRIRSVFARRAPAAA